MPNRARAVYTMLIPLSFLACKSAYLEVRLSVWVPDSAATVAHEYYSGMELPARLAVTDAATWRAVWQQIYAKQQPQPDAPAVDFDETGVLVAALGERPSGGFDIRIDSVVRFERRTVVYLTERSPGPDCGVTLALTQPVHAVLAPLPVEVDEWHAEQTAPACT